MRGHPPATGGPLERPTIQWMNGNAADNAQVRIPDTCRSSLRKRLLRTNPFSEILSRTTGTSSVATVMNTYRITGFGIILARRRAVRRLIMAAVTERRIGNVDGLESP